MNKLMTANTQGRLFKINALAPYPTKFSMQDAPNCMQLDWEDIFIL